MADDFERRFRQQRAETFRPGGTPIAWIALAVDYLRFSDEKSNPRPLDQQFLNVLNRARRNFVFVPWHYVLADETGGLRDLMQSDVGVATQVLKALVGDVILETRQVEGQAKPQVVARFTLNAVPALAALERGGPTDRDGAPVPAWDSIHSSPSAEPATAGVTPRPSFHSRRPQGGRMKAAKTTPKN